MVGIVAGRAGDRSVAREAAVVEQPPPQLDFFRRERIVLRDRNVDVQSQGDGEHGGTKPDYHRIAFSAGRKFSSAHTSNLLMPAVNMS